MQPVPRITVEVPVLSVGPVPSGYEALGTYVNALRRPCLLYTSDAADE